MSAASPRLLPRRTAAFRGGRWRTAFTLVELLVVVVVIGVLASLSLAGLAGARQRGKIDKTKSTIRKLNEIIVPQYESYITRRLTFTLSGSGAPAAASGNAFDFYTGTTSLGTTYYGPRTPSGVWPTLTAATARRALAQSRLQKLRTLLIHEMPDTWSDVAFTGTRNPTTNLATHMATITLMARTQTATAYASYLNAIYEDSNRDNSLGSEDVNNNGVLDTGEDLNGNSVLDYGEDVNRNGLIDPLQGSFGSAECLYMICTRSGYEPTAMEQFRSDEVGDADKDMAPEFQDGWGNPIFFIRWAPGASSPLGSGTYGINSPIQIANPTLYHDPFDPQRVDANGFALTPLIVSGGPDGAPGLIGSGTSSATAWSALVQNVSGTNTSGTSLLSLTLSSVASTGTVGWTTSGTLASTGAPLGIKDSTSACLDNITNHDLTKK